MPAKKENRMRKEFEEKDIHQEVRLNKYLSEAGVCSRREADRLIEEGKVFVDGVRAENGWKASDEMEISVNGKRCSRGQKMVLLAFHKPEGVVCTTDRRWNDVTVEDVLQYPTRVFSVGRLDKDSEGLLLLTNQGDLVNRIMRAGNYHEKEYAVTVDKEINEEFLRGMRNGVPILDTVTRPCTVRKTGKRSFQIILTQGLNRQIRRMCEYFGYQVQTLKRVRIMNLTLDGLKPGEYRDIRAEERVELNSRIRNSSSETIKETGGHKGNISRKPNERTGKKTERGSKGLLSGRPGDHEQQRVRRSVRSAGKHGGGNRHRSGRQSNC